MNWEDVLVRIEELTERVSRLDQRLVQLERLQEFAALPPFDVAAPVRAPEFAPSNSRPDASLAVAPAQALPVDVAPLERAPKSAPSIPLTEVAAALALKRRSFELWHPMRSTARTEVPAVVPPNQLPPERMRKALEPAVIEIFDQEWSSLLESAGSKCSPRTGLCGLVESLWRLAEPFSSSYRSITAC